MSQINHEVLEALIRLLLTVGGVDDNNGEDWGVEVTSEPADKLDLAVKFALKFSVSFTLTPAAALIVFRPVVGCTSEMLLLMLEGVKPAFEAGFEFGSVGMIDRKHNFSLPEICYEARKIGNKVGHCK
ncbi:hypothetical protein OGATHE_002908 [Ogataea polymorpha]|uniref:Uncharacterized protein n=1 Tax=Ogataea polymorpha TaxID=460523 RepID=A0A9P8PEB1_9ASCO|nr:hypothetical protein OGATHE_002908 [Ogataea polymorpha]